jgi:hypothetical protein|tara:strand:- start:2069 stop:2470 length:402 start_codon:yes stop_codon:yes gene_type:complete
MKYTIREIKDGVATVDFEDGAWAEVPMAESDTVETFNSKVGDYSTKAYTAPSWAASEASIDGSVVEREAVWDARNPLEVAIPTDDEDESSIEWINDRVNAYGPVSSQIEFIVENGLDAWIEEVKQIKADNPKS